MRTADGNAARQNGERTGYNGARQTGEQNTEQNGYNVARVNSDQNTYNASTRQQGDANGYMDPVRANGDYASYDDQNGYGVRSNADANGFRANGYDTDNAQNGEADSDAVYRDDPCAAHASRTAGKRMKTATGGRKTTARTSRT